MKKKRSKLSAEERAELDARYESTTRLLKERLAYHAAKLKEEKGLDLPPTLDERIAYHEARLAERRAASGG